MKKLTISNSMIILCSVMFIFIFNEPCICTDKPLQLSEITAWAYQIQDLSELGAVDLLVNSPYDMLVLEPTRTDWSSDDKYFDTKDMVNRLKNSKASDGVHRKLVIAYIDIGEAEDWRWYWTWSTDWNCKPPRPNDWPDYIIKCDPDEWEGNYPVAYWDSLWKDIIIYGKNQNSAPYGDYTSVLDEVIRDGFDGIYLDWVEAFEDQDVAAAAQAAGKDPAVEMIAFIQEMKNYAAARNPDFIIIQQNASSLCDGHSELFGVIDAISQEAIWFDGDATDDWDDTDGYDWKNDTDLINYYIGYLDQYKNAGLPVFNCEYALENAYTAYLKSLGKGYVPYVTRRSLSQLTTTSPPCYGSSPAALSTVKTFLYQLDELNLVDIGNTDFDLVIIDYSSDGSEEEEFTEEEIDSLKHSPGGDKIVLAYMSIGEAEDYRFYWKKSWNPGNPSWLDAENPNWEGCYKVRYWKSGWQNIIFEYTDRLLDAGFDGAYLDIIDAFEYYADKGRITAAQDMADFVAAISAHARAKDTDFLIFPQNAAELASQVPGYLDIVDGMGQEDIYYGYEEDGKATSQEVTTELENYLNLFRDSNKLVLTVDYPFSNSEDVPHFDAPTLAKIDSAYSQSTANGYIPYCTVRNLNYLTIKPVQTDAYYVDKNHASASDSNPGTWNLPWLTIQHATETVTAGDTVYIRTGTYKERVVPQNSGGADQYIVYTAYSGDVVYIDGSSIKLPSDWGGLFDITDLSYIKISGLRIINAGPNDNNVGILVDNSSHITIEKNYTYNTASSGIGVWDSDNVTIDSNEVELACNDGEQECITVAVTDSFEVRNNHVHDGGPGTIGGEGIDIKEGSSNGKVYKNVVHDVNRLGIYVDAWDRHTYNIDVFQNIVHDCEEDGFVLASEAGGLLEDVNVYNNVAYNNGSAGITVAGWGEPVNKRPMKDIKVINNTFYHNGDNEWGGGISVENKDAQNLVIRNNICSQNSVFQIQVEVFVQNLNVDHNLIDGYRGYPDETYGSNYVEGNPLFVDSSGADFHLQGGSPAIDNGSSVDASIVDFDNNSRPLGKGIDIGAYEYTQPVKRRIYYVATGGSDTNPGTKDKPWQTIQKAAETLVPGDTVYIKDGIYKEYVITRRDGNATEGCIVFSAYPGETPVIDGTDVSSSSTGFRIIHSYIKLMGLEICNWNTGVWMDSTAHVEISDCKVHDVWYGIGVINGTHDFELNRVVIHHFTLYGFDASPSGGADCYNGTLNDCIAHTGRDPEQNVDGFALGHGTQHDFVFNRCEVYGVYDGFDISARNTMLNRCSVHECGWAGYKIWQDSVMLVNCLAYNNNVVNLELGWDDEPGTTTLQNCTFMNGHTWNIFSDNSGDTLKIINCILAGGDNIGMALYDLKNNYRGDYNIFHTDNPSRAIVTGGKEFSLDQIAAGDWTTYSGQDSHSLVVYSDTVLFVDPTNYDLHLLESSSAVDNGTSTGAPSEDYEGNSRPLEHGYDIGAYECKDPPSGVLDNDRNKMIPENLVLFQNYPNPFNASTVIHYSLPEAGSAELSIYNISGELIRTLIKGNQTAGSHRIQWNGLDDFGKEVSSGVYMYRLKIKDSVRTRRLLLLR